MEVALEFALPDAAAHQRLVELIFTGERSWLTPAHPRDDLLRSFGHLVTTLWRVLEPRRPARRRAPRLPGPWRCRVGGEDGVCLAASPFGALIELAEPFSIQEGSIASLVLGGAFTSAVELRGRVLHRDSPRRLALEFEWEEVGGMEAFGRALYAGHPSGSRVATAAVPREAEVGRL